MLNEDKFNKRFSVVLMALMLAVTAVITIFKAKEPDTRLAFLLLASFGTLMGFSSALLSARGIIWTFFFGILDVLAVAVVSFDNAAWGNFALHILYLFPMQIVGITQWKKRGARGTERAVRARRLSWGQRAMIGLAALACFAAAFFILLRVQEATVPYGGEVNRTMVFFDAAVLTFNIIGQILMSLAYMEQWIIWNVVNLSNIGLWSAAMVSSPESGYTVVMLIKYIFYLVNSINGLRIWLRLSRKS